MSGGALESSITLEDVFTVVQGKRVPLAAELAGYLALEIADGANATAGDIEPRHVFIGEEGTVALVQPSREAQAAETEAAVRAILGRLLEASGSQTPALGAAARRKPGAGLPALVEELEAALIPVNRAAGRRALARLAREVKRVTMGIGRNAAPTSERRGEEPVRAKAPSHFEDDTTMRRPDSSKGSIPPPAVQAVPPQPAPPQPAPPQPDTSGDITAVPGGVAPVSTPAPPAAAPAAGPRPPSMLFAGDEVDSLLATFEVSSNLPDKAVSHELKAIAGLEPTPPPPATAAISEAPGSRTGDDKGDAGDSVEALLAITEPKPALQKASGARKPATEEPKRGLSMPPVRAQTKTEPLIDAPMSTRNPPVAATDAVASPAAEGGEYARPQAPRASLAIKVFLLIALGAGIFAVYKYYPAFFQGRRGAVAEPQAPQAGGPPVTLDTAARCKVTLTVAGVPDGAEVLLRVGQAPLDVERMPKGPRLEFVATAEGFAPKRTVIAKGAAWDVGEGGKPRYELAVQLDPSKVKAPALDPWPAGEPGSEVGGSGQPGTVHLVATPKGAEIWLLAGVGPQAQIDQLRCDADVEVLVAAKNRPRLKLTSKDMSQVPTDPTGIKAIKLNAAPQLLP
jgi:hypothetical protein